MNCSLGDNLRRLMANQGLAIEELAKRSRVDRRTIRGILAGRKKPHPRTLYRLAESLGTSGDEFFLDPTQLLYRHFDRCTNPVVQEVLDATPELFAGWNEADFDELHSRFGVGGCLTAEGVVATARDMNDKRIQSERFALLLESSEADVARGIIDVLWRKILVTENPAGNR